MHARGVTREIASYGGAVVAILHDLNLAMTCADRIVLLDRGTIAGTELLPDVFSCPLAIVPHPAGTQPLVVPLGPGVDDPVASGIAIT